MNWKRHERKVARVLGGQRNSRGLDFSLSIGDVEHPTLSVECKYRKKLSRFLVDGLKQAEGYAPEKMPVLVLKEKNMRGELAVLRLDDFKRLLTGQEGGR